MRKWGEERREGGGKDRREGGGEERKGKERKGEREEKGKERGGARKREGRGGEGEVKRKKRDIVEKLMEIGAIVSLQSCQKLLLQWFLPMVRGNGGKRRRKGKG